MARIPFAYEEHREQLVREIMGTLPLSNTPLAFEAPDEEPYYRIVYEMIKDGSMSKTDRDRIDHFFGVFDFDAAFSTEGVQDTLERLRHEHPHRV